MLPVMRQRVSKSRVPPRKHVSNDDQHKTGPEQTIAKQPRPSTIIGPNQSDKGKTAEPNEWRRVKVYRTRNDRDDSTNEHAAGD